MTEVAHYKLLKIIQDNSETSQRQLARETGISLGKVNACLKILVVRGCVKLETFRDKDNRLGYLYLLTPEGIRERARLATHFLNRNKHEREQLKMEIAELTAEIEQP